MRLCYWNWGPAVCCSKANKGTRLVERKICFISDTSNGVGVVGGVDSYPKADFPSVGKRFYRRRGAPCSNNPVSSDSHLEIDHASDLISAILIVFSTVSLQFHGQFVPIFEASSQNCGSLCHGFSLVIMWLTFPPAWVFSIYKTAHRIWLRMLSTALEEEQKVLDFA